jgi:hypothetical protein
VKQLSSELATAQMEAKGLKNEMRNLQVDGLLRPTETPSAELCPLQILYILGCMFKITAGV